MFQNPWVPMSWIIFANFLDFCFFGVDKRHAKRALTRIPESTLIWLAICGGSIGAWLGMYVFHHKTKHRRFTWGIPIIIVCQFILFLYLNYLMSLD